MNDVLTAPHPFHFPGLQRRIALIATAVLAGANMVLASPACAKVELLEHAITAFTGIRYSDAFGPLQAADQTDFQISVAPFVFFHAGGGTPTDGVADSFSQRPGITQGRQLYAVAVQKSTSNAVSAQTTYTGGPTVEVLAKTHWRVTVKNTGTVPEPVDFSFFISGGGLDAWCASCTGSGLVMSAVARISRGGNPDSDSGRLWTARTELNATSETNVQLRSGLAAGSFDPEGIGFPETSMIGFPEGEDHFFRAAISPFDATLRLFTLQPGEIEQIHYILEARISGSGTALGGAWLVDPFSLGTPHSALPGSAFALNGVPITALLVPEPSQWLLVLSGIALLGGLSRRRLAGTSRPIAHAPAAG